MIAAIVVIGILALIVVWRASVVKERLYRAVMLSDLRRFAVTQLQYDNRFDSYGDTAQVRQAMDFGYSLGVVPDSQSVETTRWFLRVRHEKTHTRCVMDYSKNPDSTARNYARCDVYDSTLTAPISPPLPLAPLADFVATQAAPVTDSVALFAFDGRTSLPGSGGPVTAWSWTYGDGSVGAGAASTHAFRSSGSFLARLIVTDSSGGADTTSRMVVVPPLLVAPLDTTSGPSLGTNAPIADFSVAGALLPSPGIRYQQNTAVTFTETASDLDNDIVSYAWDFGVTVLPATVRSVQRTFATVGAYTVRLTVTDAGGRSGVATKQILVADPTAVSPPPLPPVAIITPIGLSAFAGAQFVLDGASSSDPQRFPLTYQWSVRGGPTSLTNATSVIAQASPSDTGAVWVTLAVTNSAGLVGTDSLRVRVIDLAHLTNRPPRAVIQPMSPFVLTHQDYVLDGTASFDLDGDSLHFHWEVTGETARSGRVLTGRRSAISALMVRLIVSDGIEVDTAVAMLDVVEAPVVSFSATPIRAAVGQPVAMDPSPSTTGTVVPPWFTASPWFPMQLTVAWDFGDGQTSEWEFAPSHSFSTPGIYTVRLIGTNFVGLADTASRTVVIGDPPSDNLDPVAIPVFTRAGAAGTGGHWKDRALTVTGSSSYDPDGTITAYAWDFGDFRTATGVSASVSYAAIGTTPPVTLTVTDNVGRTSSASTSTMIIENTGTDDAVPPIGTPSDSTCVASLPGSAITVAIPNPQTEFMTFTVTRPGGLTGVIPVWRISWPGAPDAVSMVGSSVTVRVPFTAAGLLVATVSLRESLACAGGAQQAGELSGLRPDIGVPRFVATPEPASPGSPISFDGSSSLNAASFRWDFGDATTATGMTTNHTYEQPGTYTVVLTTRTALGISSSHAAVVRVALPPVVLFTGGDGVADSVMTLSAVGSYQAGTTPDERAGWTITWDFGDGTSASGTFATHASVTKAYTGPGTYAASALITTPMGLTGTSSAPMRIRNRPSGVNVTAVISAVHAESRWMVASFRVDNWSGLTSEDGPGGPCDALVVYPEAGPASGEIADSDLDNALITAGCPPVDRLSWDGSESGSSWVIKFNFSANVTVGPSPAGRPPVTVVGMTWFGNSRKYQILNTPSGLAGGPVFGSSALLDVRRGYRLDFFSSVLFGYKLIVSLSDGTTRTFSPDLEACNWIDYPSCRSNILGSASVSSTGN